MASDYTAVYQALSANPPRRLSAAAVSLVSLERSPGGGCDVVWQVAVPECAELCRIVGYHDSSPDGSSVSTFSGPIGIDACGRTITLFDSSKDGYNAVVDTIEGHAARDPETGFHRTVAYYTCPKCNTDRFAVTVELSYLIGAIDIFSDNPQLPWPDMFDAIAIDGRCMSCGHRCQIAYHEGL